MFKTNSFVCFKISRQTNLFVLIFQDKQLCLFQFFKTNIFQRPPRPLARLPPNHPAT